MTSTQETEAFGRSIGGTGATANPFGGFHGSEGYRSDGDGPQGLEPYQKVGARYYDATFGRFITRDTELDQAPYAYCDGDPVNCSDPSGHLPVNIASPGVPTINGPAGTGTGILELPGNASDDDSDVKNPYPGVGGDPPSGITGGVTGSGLNSTASLTLGTTTLVGTSNNGQLTSGSAGSTIPVGDGLGITFTDSVNRMPGLDNSSLGITYTNGPFTGGVSESSTGVTMVKIGLKF